MGEGKENIVRRTISLRPEDERLVLAFGAEMGLDFSSALRLIINEWRQQRERWDEVLDSAAEVVKATMKGVGASR